ncbi:hypothetical protein IAQ61_006080 [Plenodomus lingam]|uniref:uncharacterized protein n=1 Tax=Leptosphaeria maculans TaxID=5022 RepID=UPI00331D4E21|nr:hypothetical protein IAQ61_006080 [Plenodomus lingam]
MRRHALIGSSAVIDVSHAAIQNQCMQFSTASSHANVDGLAVTLARKQHAVNPVGIVRYNANTTNVPRSALNHVRLA